MKRAVLTLLILAATSPCFAKYSGGSGDPNDPYQIANVEDLLALAAGTNDYDKHFVLMNDLDLDPNLPGNRVFTTAVIAPDTNNSNWSFDGNFFAGVFDGADHKISNLTIDTNGIGNDCLALFGVISSGEVKNLGLENISITGVIGGSSSHYLAGLVAESSYSTINNCYSTGSITGGAWIGGLIGNNTYGTIGNCFSTSTVTGGDNSYVIGGLVSNNDRGAINNCHYTGTVAAGNNSYELGGLAGHNSILPGYNDGTISNCYSTGTVTGGNNSERLGGLVGLNKGKISNCFSTDDVAGGNGSNCLGGLAGITDWNSISNSYSTGHVTGSNYIGGLVGYKYGGSINNSYSTGSVSGINYLGGFVGYEYYGSSISSCYFLDVAGPNNGYGTPLMDEQMKQQASFVGWDFNDVWHICETFNYPKLLWQIPPGDIVCPDGVGIEDLAELCEQWLFVKISADVAPPGGDGIVNFADFAVFADQWGVTNDIYTLLDFTEQWLKVGLSNHSADISPSPNGDGIVNFADLAVMANHWLEGF
jgi:hypothetical protein